MLLACYVGFIVLFFDGLEKMQLMRPMKTPVGPPHARGCVTACGNPRPESPPPTSTHLLARLQVGLAQTLQAEVDLRLGFGDLRAVGTLPGDVPLPGPLHAAPAEAVATLQHHRRFKDAPADGAEQVLRVLLRCRWLRCRPPRSPQTGLLLLLEV